MELEKLREKLEESGLLFYGEMEYFLDEYLPKFFEVDVKSVGFNEEHPMNNLQFWFTVSWLTKMGFLEYGTSPRGAWLTEDGKRFKEYILSTPEPIEKALNVEL